jgi:hypothetical protein
MWRIIFIAGLITQGLIHLIGFVVPWQLAKIQGYPYRDEIWGGQVLLGATGIRIVGVLWLVAAIGFVLAGLGLVWGSLPWRRIGVVTAIFSIALSIVGWPGTQSVALIDFAILGILVGEHWMP